MDSGFWFEPMFRGPFADEFRDIEPNEVLVTLFRDNVAHSNLKGFRTYPAGGIRAQSGSKNHFTNLKAFRNRGDGIFIHVCLNLVIEDSIFADNAKGIDIDRADAIDVRNTVVIGESEIFRRQYESQDLPDNCRQNRLIGVELHTLGRRVGYSGASLEGVTFSGFENTHCDDAFAMNLDGSVSR